MDVPRVRVKIQAKGKSIRSVEFRGAGALEEATAFFDDMKHDAAVFELSLAKFNGDDWQVVIEPIRRGRRGKWEAAL